MTIITNHQPRLTLYGYELTDTERKEFDHLDFTENGNGLSHTFIRYRDWIYDMDELLAVWNDSQFNKGISELSKQWDGYASDSYFGGIVCNIIDDDHVIMGRYYS